MNLQLEALELNLRDYEDADQKTKQLAAFCAELLMTLKFTLGKN